MKLSYMVIGWVVLAISFLAMGYSVTLTATTNGLFFVAAIGVGVGGGLVVNEIRHYEAEKDKSNQS